MSERELIAMMAAVLRAGDIANGEVTSSLHGCVDEAEAMLAEIDARAAARREPPETYEQRLARTDATAKRVVAQLNAQEEP